MGQYFYVVNIDKRERLCPFDFDCGMKLMEWSYNDNKVVKAMMNLLGSRWAGDRVYVVGDYAEADRPEEPCYNALREVLEELDTNSLYRWAGDNCVRLLPGKVTEGQKVDATSCKYRYLVNHATRQYVDLSKCPMDDRLSHFRPTSIAPISLLLAMGNERGFGDYHKEHPGFEYVGSWCDTIRSVTVSRRLPQVALNVGGQSYTEFAPGFTEKESA